MIDVVVVGAGVAGCVAARELLASGLTVRVLEARDRVGGRLAAADVDPGLAIEVGGEFYRPAGTPVLAGELARLGIATGPAHRTQRQFVLDGGELHDMADVFAADPAARRRLVTTVRAAALRMRDADEARALDAERISDALAALDLPPRIATWFRCWIEQYAGTSLDRISVANMLKLVAGAGGSLRAAAFVSGSHLLPDTRALTSGLAAPVLEHISFGEVVSSIARTGDGFEVTTSAGVHAARAVVVAAPRNVLAYGGIRLDLDWAGETPSAVLDLQPGLGYKQWARLSETAPELSIVLGDLGGFRILGTGERQADGSVWAVLFGSQHTLGAGVQDLDREVRDAVATTFGGTVDVLEVAGHDWVADPYARGAWTTAPVQEGDPIADLLARQPEGVAFAGADFSSERGGVESALKSGLAAAARVRDTLTTPERSR